MEYDFQGNAIEDPERRKKLQEEEKAYFASQAEEPVIEEENNEASEEVDEEVDEVVEEEPKESNTAYNLRRLREEKERLQQELYQERKAKDDLLKYVTTSGKNKEVEEVDPDLESDQLVEVKDLAKVKLEMKKLKEQLDLSKHETWKQSIETRVKASCPDVDDIITRENIEALREKVPSLVSSIENQDYSVEKVEAMYSAITEMGIVKKKNNPFKQDKEQFKKNQNKPRQVNSVTSQKKENNVTSSNVSSVEKKAERRKLMYELANQ